MHEKKARVVGSKYVEHFIESYNMSMMQEYRRCWGKSFMNKESLWKTCVGAVRFYSLYLSLKHHLLSGIHDCFSSSVLVKS